MTPRQVLDFWFLPPGDPAHGHPRNAWFDKDAAFDAEIGTRFGAGIAGALAGDYTDWLAAPDSALAYILVLDQFTRNVFRNTARAFAGDARALAAAEALVTTGNDQRLSPAMRVFAYLPFEHAESIAHQDRAVMLFEQLAATWPPAESYLDYARRHREVIARFGRFPHRNAQLGRATTEVERHYLAQHGSGF